MQNHPLIKVVFIQKVVAFTKTKSLGGLFRFAYVNNPWNDAIKNYSFHLFEARVRAIRGAGTLENVCARVIQCDVIWFVDVVMSTKTVLDRVNFPMLVCQNRTSSLAMAQLVFAKIVEIGGPELLKSKLTAINNFRWTCLMAACSYSSSPEVVKLVFEKIVEVGGKDLLQSQFLYKNDDGWGCLMLCCSKSSSTGVMELLFDKIIEAGGPDLLQRQFSATNSGGFTCLMLGCRNSSSPEVMTVFFDKIVEAGGVELLKNQFSATSGDGRTSLVLAWCNSSSEVVKFVLHKFLEVSGKDLLQSQLTKTDDDGRNCLMHCCRYSSSPEVVKLLAVILFVFGVFEEQYAKLHDYDKEELSEKAEIEDASWTPDADSIAEVKKMLKC